MVSRKLLYRINEKNIGLVSVHRYYESRRRLFNDTQPGRAEKAEVMKKETRKRSLRKKVLHMFTF